MLQKPFSPLFASRLHPVPRHTGISSHLSEQWLKKRAKRLHCYQGCSWTKGPTVKREVILYNNSMWRWGYWFPVRHIMLMLLRERTQWPLRVEYKDERTLLLKAVLGLMKCYLLYVLSPKPSMTSLRLWALSVMLYMTHEQLYTLKSICGGKHMLLVETHCKHGCVKQLCDMCQR